MEMLDLTELSILFRYTWPTPMCIM